MEGNLGFGEGNSGNSAKKEKKGKNEKFYFAKVEALLFNRIGAK
jgi:hypothetical protein